MSFDRELAAALEAVAIATVRISADYAAFVAIPDAPASISTETDRASQELILTYLHQQFPDDALCAEEATPTLAAAKRTGSRIWIVDPIDGTRGFAMKNGEFSVMVGFMVDGQVVVGVVGEPAVDRITYAQRGGGCWVRHGGNPAQRCSVTKTTRVAESTLAVSHAKQGRPDPVVETLRPRSVAETYSAGVKLAMTARGEVDLYVNTYPRFADWDICAGDILVEEAGGRFSELSGKPITYCKPDHSQTGGSVASNGLLHDEVCRLLSPPAAG